MKCKHNHECERCISDEIKKHEEKIAELKKKLPADAGLLILEKLRDMKREHEKNYIPVPYYPVQPIYVEKHVHHYPTQYWGTWGIQSGTSQLNMGGLTAANSMNALQGGISVALAQ